MERLTYKGTPTMTEEGFAVPVYSDYSLKEIKSKLAEYEDAEEQGLLLRLPCKVGSVVYAIVKNEIIQDTVEDYDIWSVKSGLHLRIRLMNYKDYVVGVFGKDIFLTKEEAEQKLKQVGE